MNSRSETILLVGAGYMAREYAKVLIAMKLPFVAVGRSEKSAGVFKTETGVNAVSGGIKEWLKENKPPKKAIIAVTEDQLGITTRELINAECKEILVEKPGGLNTKDIKDTKILAKKGGTKVYVGYNRRFYASVSNALEIIKKEGVLSFNFDFTERSYIVENLPQSNNIKKEWFLHNSTHVIDMAFFMGGWPKKMTSYKKDSLKWHPSGAIYSGAGISQTGALFSYHANWKSAGKWSVEIITSKNKLIFRPLEKLRVQKYGSMAAEEFTLNDELDQKFKPGLYKQVESFLGSKKHLFTIKQQLEHLKHYKTIQA